MLKLKGLSGKSFKIYGLLPQIRWITNSILPTYFYNYNFTQDISISSKYPIIKVEVTNGSLPSGVFVTQGGMIFGRLNGSGTPTVSNFTLTATDSSGFSDSKAFTLTITEYNTEVVWVTAPAILDEYGIGQGVYQQVIAESEIQ